MLSLEFRSLCGARFRLPVSPVWLSWRGLLQLNLMQSYGDMRGWQYYSQKIGKNENILDFWHKTENILYLATRLSILQLVCGQDLRSFVSKTYVRLWNTLDDGSEGHLCLVFRV